MKTTLTTFYGGQHARRIKNAARFRGGKEDVVFVVSNKIGKEG